jgi:hypothetical protein
MLAADSFMSKFDEEGRYSDSDGVLDVEFMTSGGNRYPGRLHFYNGLCVRAEMQEASPWAYPDNSPLNEVSFTIYVEGERAQTISIDQGRVVHHNEVRERMTKKDFLGNVHIARNRFVHSSAREDHAASPAIATASARTAIWLTPKSVKGFNAADFSELGLDRRAELETAVQNFLAVAKQVPANRIPTPDQYRNATAAFQKIIEILQPYLPMPEEANRVEGALRTVAFPAWVVNWDYELGSDEEGGPAAWVNIFAEDGAPRNDFGRFALQIIPKIRQAFSTAGVDRWPYVRLRTAAEHKSA